MAHVWLQVRRQIFGSDKNLPRRFVQNIRAKPTGTSTISAKILFQTQGEKQFLLFLPIADQEVICASDE